MKKYSKENKDKEKEFLESPDALLPGNGVSWYKFSKPDYRILKTFDSPEQVEKYTVKFVTEELTALCPLTSFPDYYSLEVQYVPQKLCIESKSFKFYCQSFRDEGMFIETLANRMVEDLVKVCDPEWLQLEIVMNPRGGVKMEVVCEYGGCLKGCES